MFVFPTMCKEIKEKFLKKKKRKGIIHSKPNSKGPKQEQPGTVLWHHLQDIIMGCHVFVFIGLHNYAVPPKIKMKGETQIACVSQQVHGCSTLHWVMLPEVQICDMPVSTEACTSFPLEFLDLFCECFAYMYACMCKLGAHSNQRRTLNALELELWTAVSCHVSAGNRTCILCKDKYFYPLNHLSSPWVNFLKTTRQSPFFLFPLLPTSLCFLFLENLSTPCK